MMHGVRKGREPRSPERRVPTRMTGEEDPLLPQGALLIAVDQSKPAVPAGHHPNTYAHINGITIVASDSITNFGVSTPSLPHVIFSFGTAPLYEP